MNQISAIEIFPLIHNIKYYFSHASHETIFLGVAYERNHPLKSHLAGGRTPYFRIVERSKNPQAAVGWSRDPRQYSSLQSLLSSISGMP